MDDAFTALINAEAAFDAAEQADIRTLAIAILADIPTPQYNRALGIHLADETTPLEARTWQARSALALAYGAVVTSNETVLQTAAGRHLASLVGVIRLRER